MASRFPISRRIRLQLHVSAASEGPRTALIHNPRCADLRADGVYVVTLKSRVVKLISDLTYVFIDPHIGFGNRGGGTDRATPGNQHQSPACGGAL